MPRFINNPIRIFQSFSKKKKIISIVIVVILMLIVFQVVSRQTAKPAFESAKVTKSNVTETVTETGSIAASGRTDVYSPTTGVVTEVNITNNVDVQEGDTLFTVESSATEQEQTAAYANYLTAVSALNAAKSNLNVYRSAMYSEWDTFRNLATNDTYETGDGQPKEQNRESAEFQIAQDDWKAAEAKYKDQQKAVAQGEAQVASTYLLYQATQNAVVKAQTSGTIANLSVAGGSPVRVSLPTLPSRPVLTILKPGVTEVVISLSESDIAKVSEGQDVEIDVSAVDDKTYTGIVQRVDTVGTDEGGVVRYNAYIEITDADDSLRSGMSADVTITTSQLTGVLAVPNAAVKPYKGGRAVRIYDQKKREIVYVPVKIGVRGTEMTEILSGITEGQEVITSLSNEALKRPGLFGM